MIAHFSIPSRNPRATADVFARIIDGVVMPFPPAEGGWIVIARDGSGTGVEVVPDTAAIFPGSEPAAGARYGQAYGPVDPSFGAVHVAMTTTLSREEVIALGEAQGWRTLHADRGPFDLVEVWVDDRIMVEVLPPESTARYMAISDPAAAEQSFQAPAHA